MRTVLAEKTLPALSAPRLEVVEQRVDLVGPHPVDRKLAEHRRDQRHGVGVVLVGLRLALGRLHRRLQPPRQVGRDGRHLGIERDSLLEIVRRPAELVAGFALRVAGVALVLDVAVRVEADGNLGDPAAGVTSLVDRALAIRALAALARRRIGHSTHLAQCGKHTGYAQSEYSPG